MLQMAGVALVWRKVCWANCLLWPHTGSHLVNCPTIWSLLFIFGFLCWSSSWRWQPHIGVCRLLWPLLRAGMAVLTQFFCKMYFLCVSQSRKKSWATFFWFYPLKELFFSRRGSLAVQISREVVLQAQEPPLWKSAAQHFWWAEHRLWSSVWLSRFPERWFCWQRNHLSGKAEPPLWKSDVASEKRSPWPPKKSLSPIPSENVLFAKNRIKIGKIWPLQLHFWSTHAYRGFPPYAIFPIPDTKKYSIVLC